MLKRKTAVLTLGAVLACAGLAQAHPPSGQLSRGDTSPSRGATTQNAQARAIALRRSLPLVQVAGHRYEPRSFDGHVHTVHSPDAREPTLDILALAARTKLDALVLTDHGLSIAASDLRAYDGPVLVSMGEEVGGPWGHAVLWNVDHRRGVAAVLDNLTDLGKHVHAQGGLLVLAHPTWWMKGHEDAMRWMAVSALRRGGHSGEIDAFELWNCIYIERQEQLLEAWLTALEAGVFVPAVGASDFHRRATHKLGRPRNVALTETHSLDAMLEALRVGRSYITDEAGIALTVNDSATLGDVLAIVPGAALRVELTVSAPHNGGTLVLYLGRTEVLREALPSGGIWQRNLALPAPAVDSYLRAEIVRPTQRTGRPRFSLVTNPVRLDVAPMRTAWR